MIGKGKPQISPLFELFRRFLKVYSNTFKNCLYQKGRNGYANYMIWKVTQLEKKEFPLGEYCHQGKPELRKKAKLIWPKNMVNLSGIFDIFF